jgi:hypothetical protein
MIVAMLAVAALQGPVTLPAPPLRYRIEAKTTTEQDLTSINRGKVAGALAAVAFVTVTTTDSAEGQISRIAIDSMKLEPTGATALQLTQAAANAAADSARGMWIRVFSVRGTIKGAPRPSGANAALAPVMQAVGVLFPGLRSGLKVGDGWADTTKIDNDVQGGHQRGQIVATWKVTGSEEGAFLLDGTAVTNVTTNGQAGESLTVNGSSVEHLALATRGPARSASIESTRLASTVRQQGATPIPTKTVASLRLIPIP